MTDKQMYALLKKFANEHSIAKGGGIRVTINSHTKVMSSKPEYEGMAYEDVCLLWDLIRGAEAFLLWQRRKNGKG